MPQDEKSGPESPEELSGDEAFEDELEAVMAALRELKAASHEGTPRALGVFRVFSGLSRAQWSVIAKKYRLDSWLAVPVELSPAAETVDWKEILAESLARDGIDPLTRLPGLERFRVRFKAEMQRAIHTGTDLSVVLLDIDNSRAVKQRYGKEARDDAFLRIAETMCGCLRMYDVCTRLAGDEFALVLPGTPPLRALALAERLKDHVHRLRLFSQGGEHFSLTFSAGIASLSQAPGMSEDELLDKADEALREAKRQGRDRVLLAGDFSEYETKVLSSEKQFLFFGDSDSGEPSL